MSANPNVRAARCGKCGSWECGTECRFPAEEAYWYADYKIRDAKLRGHPEPQASQERSTDGRRIYP